MNKNNPMVEAKIQSLLADEHHAKMVATYRVSKRRRKSQAKLKKGDFSQN